MIDKKELIKLYQDDGLSSSEVAKILGTTVWKVISFMRKNNIIRRTSSESKKIQFEKEPLTYNKKSTLNVFEKNLLIAGLLIYLGEGSKVGTHTVDLANSDLKTQLIFLKMLRKIYVVNETKLRVYLYCFPNQNVDELLYYWSTKLNIPISQFSKPYIRKDFDPKKSGRMNYGLVHVRYNDKKLLRQIIGDIDIITRDLLK